MKNEDLYPIKPIAYIYTDFHEKFGIPRQSELVEGLYGKIVFEEEFRDANALRGIEESSHLWLIWGFSRTRVDMTADRIDWAPVVAPPRLGGRVKMGVFATRSPYRPNSLGLSCVRLKAVEKDSEHGTYLIVEGADILDGTPVYDIKPYLPSDSKPEATEAFAARKRPDAEVIFPVELLEKIAEEKRKTVIGILRQDPRGAYEKQPGYVYGISFADYEIRFTAEGDAIKVIDVLNAADAPEHVK